MINTTSVHKSVCKVVGATLIVVLLATSAGAQWAHIPSTDPDWVIVGNPDWDPSGYGWPTGDDDSVIALWQPNEYAEYLFQGTQVRLYGIKSSEGATADIKIDGQIVAAGVSWNKSGQPQDHVMLYESAVLSAGGHTFRIDNPGDWINIDYLYILSTEDTNPPTPDPMTWLIVPVAFPGNEIVMTATTAVDPSGVEYYFDETTGGGNDSGWQDSPSYTDTGLSNGTQYCYQVRARDKSVNQNTGAYSSTECATAQTQPPTTDYYIDSVGGNDNNNGTSESTPWETLSKVSSTTFSAGDNIYFKRGSSYSGCATINGNGTAGNPITVGAYGNGNAPSFTNPSYSNNNGNAMRIRGDYQIVENLYFHHTAPTPDEPTFQEVWSVGALHVSLGNDHAIIRNNEFANIPKAIQSYSEYSLITNNYIHHGNDTQAGGFLGPPWWGPLGIQLGIGNQEISYNTIEYMYVAGGEWGADGGAIELDDGRNHKNNFYIHHNTTYHNMGFLEVSYWDDIQMRSSSNIDVTFNVSRDYQTFLLWWAPTSNSTVINNTIIRDDNPSSPAGPWKGVFIMDARPADILLTKNIVVTDNDLTEMIFIQDYDGGIYDVTHTNNCYWDVVDGTVDLGLPFGSGEIEANPLFVNYAGEDYHLQSGTPCPDWGAYMFVETTCDLPGNLNDDYRVDLLDFALLGAGWQDPYDMNDLKEMAADWLIDCNSI